MRRGRQRDGGRYEALVHEAFNLRDRGELRDAAEMFFVAADQAEEDGDAANARYDRGYARRLLVALWAANRWPTRDIAWHNIIPVRELRGREQWSFRIFPRSGELGVITIDRRNRTIYLAETITIDRRNRIRVTRQHL